MRLLVYGAGAFGQLVRRHIELCGHEFEGFLDAVADLPGVLGDYESVRERLPPTTDRGVVVAVGYRHLEARWSIFGRLRDDGYTLPALTHPSAWVHPEAETGAGVLIGAGATVDAGARIGALSVLLPGVIVSHDADIGENTFLAPGAIVCGFASIGRQTFVGAGAVVLSDLPPGSFVRAGDVSPASAPGA